MKKIILNSIFVLFYSIFLISCSGEDLENVKSSDYKAKMLDVFIYDSELVGEWKVKSIIADRDIDLDGDGEYNNDLFLESSCFEEMIYTFKGDKTFTIVNPTLELSMLDNKDVFKCQTPTSIRGKWSIKDNTLILYIRTNGPDYQENKPLILIDDRFYLEINKDESKDFINDKGGSSATGLSIVALEFKRTNKRL